MPPNNVFILIGLLLAVTVIPLAKKLDRCGVFGVSHLEFLHHAQENKKEWIKKGEAITASLLARCQAKYGPKPADDEPPTPSAEGEEELK